MYSDISKRIIDSSSPKYSLANAFVNSVLPTPVGPANIIDAIGRFSFANPHLALRRDRATACTATSCPITDFVSFLSISCKMTDSSDVIFVTGMRVHAVATSAISFSVTIRFSLLFVSDKPLAFTSIASKRSVTSSSRFRKVAASSNKPASAAWFFASVMHKLMSSAFGAVMTSSFPLSFSNRLASAMAFCLFS